MSHVPIIGDISAILFDLQSNFLIHFNTGHCFFFCINLVHSLFISALFSKDFV